MSKPLHLIASITAAVLFTGCAGFKWPSLDTRTSERSKSARPPVIEIPSSALEPRAKPKPAPSPGSCERLIKRFSEDSYATGNSVATTLTPKKQLIYFAEGEESINILIIEPVDLVFDDTIAAVIDGIDLKTDSPELRGSEQSICAEGGVIYNAVKIYNLKKS